jgi:hypothetical protein
MKRALIFLGCLILGPALCCFISGTWHMGGNTFWKPIDYFPYSVKTLIAMRPFGGEFWVETTENETYQVAYPCSDSQSCWTKSQEISADLFNEEYVDYKVSNNRCENNNFVYPLFQKIRTCITSTTHAPDATYTVSLALTEDNTLWIWDNPYIDPFTVMINVILSTIAGGLIGYIIGIVLVTYIPANKKRRKHK